MTVSRNHAVSGAPRFTRLGAGHPRDSHTIILRLDGAKLPDQIKLKSTDVNWSVN